MSAKKGFETKVFDDQEKDLGIDSGPVSEQLFSSEELDTGDNIPVENKKEVISETELDSGLCLSESLSKVNLSDLPPTAQTQGPLIVIDNDKRQDIPPLTILFQQDDDGDTQLHIAAVHGCEKSVGILIRICPNKAWLDVPNDSGHTPLHLAAMSGHAVVARMLVRAGASLDIRDFTGETPLHKAVTGKSLECIQALLLPVSSQPTPSLLTVLNQKNYRGQCCVHLATQAGHLEILKTLVYFGADITATEGLAGLSPLHIAVRRGHADAAQYIVQRCPAAAAVRDYAGRVAVRLHGDDDEDDDEPCPCTYDSDSESLFEKLRPSANPINVA